MALFEAAGQNRRLATVESDIVDQAVKWRRHQMEIERLTRILGTDPNNRAVFTQCKDEGQERVKAFEQLVSMAELVRANRPEPEDKSLGEFGTGPHGRACGGKPVTFDVVTPKPNPLAATKFSGAAGE